MLFQRKKHSVGILREHKKHSLNWTKDKNVANTGVPKGIFCDHWKSQKVSAKCSILSCSTGFRGDTRPLTETWVATWGRVQCDHQGGTDTLFTYTLLTCNRQCHNPPILGPCIIRALCAKTRPGKETWSPSVKLNPPSTLAWYHWIRMAILTCGCSSWMSIQIWDEWRENVLIWPNKIIPKERGFLKRKETALSKTEKQTFIRCNENPHAQSVVARRKLPTFSLLRLNTFIFPEFSITWKNQKNTQQNWLVHTSPSTTVPAGQNLGLFFFFKQNWQRSHFR